MSDIDELIAKAEGKKKPMRCENDSRVLTYIEKTKLEAGLLKVPTYFIYWHYRQIYTYEGLYNQNKAKKVTFFRTFSKRFPDYRNKTQRFYLLNPSQFMEFLDETEVDGQRFYTIKEEHLEAAKAYNITYGNQKKPKQKKKALQLLGQEGNSSDET
jgi:hypothetical protein